MTAYGELLRPFVISSGLRQECPISPFLFNFAVDDFLLRLIEGFLDGCVVLPGHRQTRSMPMTSYLQAAQLLLNCLTTEVIR